MKIQEDSCYIEDECGIDELPSFNKPKNLTISGTGKKASIISKTKAINIHPFVYHQRSRMIWSSHSVSPRPAAKFINKFSFLQSSTSTTTPQKTYLQKHDSFESGPFFKKK